MMGLQMTFMADSQTARGDHQEVVIHREVLQGGTGEDPVLDLLGIGWIEVILMTEEEVDEATAGVGTAGPRAPEVAVVEVIG